MSERMKQLRLMLKNDPEDSFLMYAYAKELEYLDQPEKALEIYLKLKSSDPQYVGMYYHLGKLYELLEDQEKALQAYEEGIDVAKKIADYHALSELNTAKTNLELEI